MPRGLIVLPWFHGWNIIRPSNGEGPMLDFYLLSIIGFSLIGGLYALRLARKAYCRDDAMTVHACKVAGLNQSRSGDE